MKITYAFLMGLFSLVMVSFTTAPSSLDQVIGALKSGNAVELSKYFDKSVELTLPDKSNNYSKDNALDELKSFFSSHKVKGFAVKHKGNAQGADFCIGTLQTSNGDFRTNIFMKTVGGKSVVKEIRFQSSN